MKTREEALSYVDIPSVFETIGMLASHRPAVYVKFMDGRGFDITWELVDDVAKSIQKDPLALQYSTAKLAQGQVIIDFDFSVGLVRASFEEAYSPMVGEALEHIRDTREKAILSFYERKAEGQLRDIMQLESGRFITRSIDSRGTIWTEPEKKKLVDDPSLVRFVALCLIDLYPEGPFGKRLLSNVSRYCDLNVEELHKADRGEELERVLEEFKDRDEIVSLMQAVFADKEKVIDLLRTRSPEGYWMFEGKPHSGITAVAYEVINLTL